jgi:hypothetical protein
VGEKTIGEKINEDLHNIKEAKEELDKLLEEEVVDTPTEEEKDNAMALYSITCQLEQASIDDLDQIFSEMKFSSLNRVQTVLDGLRDVPNQS